MLTRNGTVTGVRTDKGEIRSEFVVNCAGMWARQLGEQIGVVIPNQAAEHYYLITEPIDGMPATCRCWKTRQSMPISAKRPAA